MRPPRIFTLLCLPLFSCAENRLTTYMLVQQAPEGQRKRGQLQLSAAPLLLTVAAAGPDELEDLADDLQLSAASRYNRLPPLTYLRFEFQNRTALGWQLNLANVRLTAGRRSFGVVKAAPYAARFTSVAYERFRYDAMYASYITLREGEKPKGKYSFASWAPHETVEIGANESGFQVLPFEFIPPGVDELTLHYTPEGSKERTLTVKLVTERAG